MLKVRGFVTDGMSVKLTPFSVAIGDDETKITVAEKGERELVITAHSVLRGHAKLRLRETGDSFVIEDIEGHVNVSFTQEKIAGDLAGTEFAMVELEGEYSIVFETAPKPGQYYGQTIEVRWCAGE